MAEDTGKPAEGAGASGSGTTAEEHPAGGQPGQAEGAAPAAEPRKDGDTKKDGAGSNAAGDNSGQLVQDAVIYGGLNIYEMRESVSFDPATFRAVRESRRMDPHRVAAIGATFVAADENGHGRFCADFTELLVGVIAGSPGAGRATTAISVLGATGLQVAEVTSDAADRGGRLDHLPAEPGHAYLLDITTLQRGRDIRDEVRRYAYRVRQCESRLIVVAAEWDDDPVDGYAFLSAQPAPAHKVFFGHLRHRAGEAAAAQWSAEPRIRDLLDGERPAYAARVAKEVQRVCTGDGGGEGADGFAGQVGVVVGIFKDRAQHVRDWFASHEKQAVQAEERRYAMRRDDDEHAQRREEIRPGDYSRVLIEAVAVLEGCPSDVVLLQVDELAEQWDVRVQLSSPISGGGLTAMLKDVGAAVDANDRIWFKERGLGDAVLDHLWHEYPKARESLLTWSNSAVRKVRPTERRAVAERWFDLAERQSDPKPVVGLLAVWGQHRDLRPAAVPIVVRAAVHDELGPAVRSYLYNLARNGPEAGRLDIALAQVCGQYGRVEPQPALVRLSHLADRAQDRAAEELHRAVDAIAAETACRPALLEALLEWAGDDRGRGRAAFARRYLADLLSAADGQGRPLILGDLGDAPERIPLGRIGDAIAAALASGRPRDCDAVADAWLAALECSVHGEEQRVLEEALLHAAAAHTAANVRLCRTLYSRERVRSGGRVSSLAERVPHLDPLTKPAAATGGAGALS